MAEVGNATVSIFPSFKGFRSKVSAEVNGATKAAGQSAGRGFSAAFDSGSGKVGDAAAKNLQRNVASASQALSKARLAEQDAAGKVRVAEAQLADARSKGAAGSARVVAAEERLESANRKLASAQERTKASSESLKSAQSSLQSALESSGSKAQSAGSRIREALSGAASKATEVAGRITSAIGTAFSTAGKVAGTFAGIVGTVLGGIAIKGGIDRALNIEDAQAKLTGLGHSTEVVTGIMTNATAAVKGTAFGLGEAATTAAGAVAAGIKPGQDLQRVLGLVADSATIAGTDMASMGSIFNKVAASGKLQGDVIAQLQDAGVPVLQFVAKEMGITAEETAKLASDGKINFETFAAAMENGLGGAAQKSGETFRGAWKNTKAALSRIGETVVTPFLGMINAGFNALIPVFDSINNALKPVMTAFAESFGPKAQGWMSALATGAAATLPSFFERIGQAVGKVREFIAPVQEGFNTLAIAAGGLVAGSLGPLLARLPMVGGLFTGLTGPIGLVAGAIIGLVTQSAPLREALGSGLQTIFQALTDTMTQIGPTLAQVGTQLMSTVGSLGDMLAPIVTTVVSALAQLIPVVGQIVAAVLPSLMAVIQAVVPVIGQLVAAILPVISTIVGVLVPVIQALLPVITTVFGVIASVVTAAMQIVQGIIMVVTGVISGNWSQVWNGIKSIFSGVWNAIKAIVQGAIAIVGSVISAGMSLASSLVSGAVNGIRNFFSSAFGALGGIVSSAIDGVVGFIRDLPNRALSVLSNIGGILVNSGRALIDGFLSGIRDAAGKIGDVVGGVVQSVRDFFPFSPAKTGPLSGRGYVTHSGKALVGDFAGSMESQVSRVRKAASSVAAAATLTTRPLVGAGTSRGSSAGLGVTGAAAGAAVQMTFNGNVGWMPDEVADQLDTRLRRGITLNNLRRVAV